MTMIIQTHTVPTLQGTLAKRTKPMLRPNFAKEPFHPSRAIAGLRDTANLINKQIDSNNCQCLTHNIKQLGFSGLRAFSPRFNFFQRWIGTRSENPTVFIL